jgi:hypothetical protein
VIKLLQRPLPTQQTQQTNIRALSGIRNRDPRNRVAADLCLRQHGHRGSASWNRTDREERRIRKKKMFQCDFVRQKSLMEGTGIETGHPSWEAGDRPRYTIIVQKPNHSPLRFSRASMRDILCEEATVYLDTCLLRLINKEKDLTTHWRDLKRPSETRHHYVKRLRYSA